MGAIVPQRRPLLRRAGEGSLAVFGRIRASVGPTEGSGWRAYLAVVLLVMATLAGAGLTMGAYQRAEAVPSGYVETAGLVEQRIGMGSGQNQSYDTIISFTAEDGREYQFRSMSSGRMGEFEDVAYDPSDPGQTAGTKADRHFSSDWWIALGVMTVVFGVGALWFGRRMSQRRAEAALERISVSSSM